MFRRNREARGGMLILILERMCRDLILQLLILALLLLVLPSVIGSLTANADRESAMGQNHLLFWWVSGFFFLWAGFQLICVPLILAERDFESVVTLFAGYTAFLTLLGLAATLRRQKNAKLRLVRNNGKAGREGLWLWILFWGLLAFQLIQAVRMTYGDGDDAYYVAVSSLTQEANTMYQKIPYTGKSTGVDTRHGLAPFPVWISFLGKVSGMPAVTVAHVILPVVLIAMTYAIFYLIGKKLFPGKNGRLPLFLVFTEILVLFGDYSYQSVENFMIARSRQGKAALGSIVIPFVLYLLLVICRKLQENKNVSLIWYLLLAAAAIAGCLCSTMGSLLICMLIGIAAIVMVSAYKKWRILLPMAACCVPCVGFTLIYLILK